MNNPKRPQTPLDFQYVTIHNTGNPSSKASGERGWLDNPSNTTTKTVTVNGQKVKKTIPSYTGWHIVIDETQAIEAVPTGLTSIFPQTTKAEVAYHAGDSTGNAKSIGIEICESGNYDKTVQEAVILVAKILYEKGWGTERLKQHNDWSGKNCPWKMRANGGVGWKRFLKDVQSELDKLKAPKKEVVDMTPQELMNLKGNANLQEWQVKVGKDAIEKLVKEGIVNNPETWLAELGEEVPNWLLFTLLSRTLEKKG